MLDLNKTVDAMLKMLHRLIGENIDMAWIPGEKVWPVRIDPAQIDQILANLCVNARDAITNVGKVTIETGNMVFDEDYCKEHAGFVPGKFAMLAVSDNGCGMDSDTLANIFEPFFTTKQQGSGLGLASVHSIVSRHDGAILVKSAPGAGTTFTVFLPACERAIPDVHPAPGECPGNGGRVLIMDDQQSVLRTVARMLKMLEFGAVCVEDGAQAVAACRQALESGTPFDAVILDLTVPGGMGGVETLNALREFWPEVRAIASSGYSTDAVMSDHPAYGFRGVVRKPYTISELGECLRGVLG